MRCATVWLLSAGLLATGAAGAPGVSSKIYVTAVNGTASIRVNGRVQPLVAKAAYPAEGTAIETQAGSTATLVLSNGTGVTLEPTTKIEIKRFVQEPFRPTRTDFEMEPSVSDMQLAVVRGTITVATNKLAFGSNLLVVTPQTDVRAQGGRLVVTVTETVTNVWVLDGGCTVRASDPVVPFQAVKKGELAVASQVAPDRSTEVAVQVQTIPAAKLVALDDQLAVSSLARKTVYFEVKETPAETATASAAAGKNQTAVNTGQSTTTETAVNAFQRSDASVAPAPPPRDIAAVPVLPVEVPVKFTVSPSLIAGGGR